MLISLHPLNPQPRLLERAAECLRDGGVIVYPTDTLYALGCDIENKKAVERICRIKGIDPEKAHLTCMCESVSIISQYANHVDTGVYKLMKRALPGPYTFILEASKKIPRHFQHKKTVGIRVADHPVALGLVQLLGNPIASISLPEDEEGEGYDNDPYQIEERFGHLTDMVLDCGPGRLEPSTVIDCSQGESRISIIRLGSGSLEALGLELIE